MNDKAPEYTKINVAIRLNSIGVKYLEWIAKAIIYINKLVNNITNLILTLKITWKCTIIKPSIVATGLRELNFSK